LGDRRTVGIGVDGLGVEWVFNGGRYKGVGWNIEWIGDDQWTCIHHFGSLWMESRLSD